MTTFNCKSGNCRCVNWFGTEFLWLPAIKTKGNSKASFTNGEKSY